MIALVPVGVVTTTSAVPEPEDGSHAMIVVVLTTLTLVARYTVLFDPCMTKVTVAGLVKPVPRMVIGVVVQVGGGAFAVTLVTVGGIAEKTHVSILIPVPHVDDETVVVVVVVVVDTGGQLE